MFGTVQMTVLFKVSSVQGQQSARERGGELTFAAGGQPPSCRPGCPHTRPGPGQTAAPSREPATHAAQHQIIVAARLPQAVAKCFVSQGIAGWI